MDNSKTKAFYNKSLERALQILNSFNAEKKATGLSEISMAVQLPKSTTLRLCSTLNDYGYLNYDKDTKQYSLGMKLFSLGALVYESLSLNKVASSFLDKLQETTRQTVLLDVLADDHVLHIEVRENPSSTVRFGPHLGTMMPPQVGAAGQILMAYLPDDELDRLLKKYPFTSLTKKTIIDEKLFKKRLRIVRKQGYLVEHGEVIDVVSAVSAPIRDYSGKVVAAVSVGWILQSIGDKEIKRITKETIKIASAISEAMGYSEKTK